MSSLSRFKLKANAQHIASEQNVNIKDKFNQSVLHLVCQFADNNSLTGDLECLLINRLTTENVKRVDIYYRLFQSMTPSTHFKRRRICKVPGGWADVRLPTNLYALNIRQLTFAKQVCSKF